jgi:putative ABC transport system permease protein
MDLAFFGAFFILLTFSLLLWGTKSTNRPASRFLALTLLAVAWWIARWLVGDIGVTRDALLSYRFTGQFTWAVGPLLYFYVHKTTRPASPFAWRDGLHFTPLLLENGILIFGDGLLHPMLELGTFISVAAYLYGCHRLIESALKQGTFTGGDRYRQEWQWLHVILKRIGLTWLLWIPVQIMDYYYYGHFRPDTPMGDWVTLLLLGMTIWLSVSAHVRMVKTTAETSSVLRSVLLLELRQKCSWLKKAMQDNRYYENPELNVNKLADLLHIPVRDLSQLINTGLNKNFNDFINEYRVAAVILKMQDPANNHMTLQGISYDAGFNPKVLSTAFLRK